MIFLLIPIILSFLAWQPEQLLTSVFLFAFIAIALATESNTYKILTGEMLVNTLFLFIFWWLPAYSLWWPVLIGVIDLIALVTILAYGDRYVKYQLTLLGSMITLHFMLAWDLAQNTSIVFDWYMPGIILITIMQILGAGGGYIRKLLKFDNPIGNSRSQCNLHAVHHHKSHR